eukprot:scaffold259_cov158-Amphora_coffeaeformis.AAC.2
MPACQECYRVKVRCDRQELVAKNPHRGTTCCSRCTKLGMECVPRTSRQGQGPKKRRKQQQQPNQHDRTVPLAAAGTTATPPPPLHSSEDGTLLEAFTITTSSNPSLSTSSSSSVYKFHYGIRYLIHSWTSFALARRSFALLGRASHLAAKCGVPMDDVFCHSRRDIINPILYNNHNHQESQRMGDDKAPQPLQWDSLPTSLRNLCGLDRIENRYVMVREAQNGHSRYLASTKFESDIVSVWLMEQTWRANQKPVVQLFLQGPEDFEKFTRAIHTQISRYTNRGKPPEFVRINGLHVIFQNDSSADVAAAPITTKEMDLVYAFEIVTLEHSFYVCEFVPPKHDHHIDAPSCNDRDTIFGEPQTAEKSDDSYDEPLRLFDSLLPLEEFDEELEAFLALIND